MKKSLFAVLFVITLIIGSAFAFKEAFATILVNFYFDVKSLPVSLTISKLERNKVDLKEVSIGRNTFIRTATFSLDKLFESPELKQVKIDVDSLDPKDFFVFLILQTGDSPSKVSLCDQFQPVSADITIDSLFVDNERTPINLHVSKEVGTMIAKLDLKPTIPILKNLEVDIGYRCDHPKEVTFKGTSTLENQGQIFNLFISEGLVEIDHSDEKQIQFDGYFIEDNLIGRLNFVGDVQKQTSKFQLDWELEKLDLKNLTTFLSAYIETLFGQLSAEGRASGSPVGLEINALLNANNVTASAETWSFENLSFKGINFVYPDFKTVGSSKVKIKNATLGKKFTDIVIAFDLISPNKMSLKSFRTDVESAELKLTQTTLTRDPFNFTPFEATIENWPLQNFMSLLYKQDVSATGRLNGSIKVGKKNGVPVIKRGLLKTQNKGRIKVRPAGLKVDFNSVPSNPKAILDNYLWDFRYDDLEMDFSSDENYEMKLTLRAFGRNQKYLDGKPLKLSVNFDLNIKDTIRSLLLTYDLPKKIEQRIYEEMQ